MASETKVGLLAGLAFIVVFAVILANRGQVDPLLSQEPLSTERHVILGEESVPADPYQVRNVPTELPKERYQSARPAPRSAKRPYANRDRIAAERLNQDQPVRNNPPGTRTITFGPTDMSPQLAIANRQSQPAPQPRLRLQQQAQKSNPTQSNAKLYADAQPHRASHAGAQRSTGGRSIPAHQVVATKEEAIRAMTLQQRIPSQVKRPDVAGTKYVVLAGDTLYGIAGKHYGKRGSKFVRAIVQANGVTLPDPDKLRVGTVLLLPTLTDSTKVASRSLARAPKKLRATQPRNAKTKKQKPKDFDWYQVKKGDRYASIAREQLGDVKRWREVFELNKEKFPNPDRIRDGVLIKIPKSRGGKKG
jgi:nucleoid-associated protein YgaU